MGDSKREKLVEVIKSDKGLSVEVKADTVTAVAIIYCIAQVVAERLGLTVQAVLESAMVDREGGKDE